MEHMDEEEDDSYWAWAYASDTAEDERICAYNPALKLEDMHPRNQHVLKYQHVDPLREAIREMRQVNMSPQARTVATFQLIRGWGQALAESADKQLAETPPEDPVQRQIRQLEVGQSMQFIRPNAEVNATLWQVGGTSQESDAVKLALTTSYGFDMQGVRESGLEYIADPRTGERLTPGFGTIHIVGNEGMVCSTGDKTYMVTAVSQADAIKNHLQTPPDDTEMLSYPFFLHGKELLVTRFDASEAKARGYHSLQQLQGNDLFGLEKGPVNPMDAVAQRDFKTIADRVEKYYQERDIQADFHGGTGLIRLPEVDTDTLSAQMVYSVHESDSKVIGLFGNDDGDLVPTGGYFMVRSPRGQVSIIDAGLRRVVESSSPEFKSYLVHAYNYADNYFSALESRLDVRLREKPSALQLAMGRFTTWYYTNGGR